MSRLLVVGVIGFSLMGCKSPVKTAAKGVAKGAKVSAKATVKGAKATGKAVKNTVETAIGK